MLLLQIAAVGLKIYIQKCYFCLIYVCAFYFILNVKKLYNNLLFFLGIEISDVLKIDDKDYSITFSLYFNVLWSEPRLNLSQEFFNSENITGDEQLVPGK